MGPESALVGRPAELATLDALLLGVARGRGAALAVAGEAGIGKSRLLTELGERADAHGMLVLSGAASEFEQDLPFWPFVDALDDYVRALPPERLTRLDDDTRSELAHVLPSWPAAARAASGSLDTDRRYRTHRSVCRLLEVLADGPPLVLLLDDLHWADSASVELLCALLRRPPCAPVLLATALRPRQVAARLAGALHRAADTGLLTRVELAGLTLADMRRLLGPDVDESLVPALHAESGGNPFYLRQLAQVRHQRAVVGRVPLDIGVPTSVAAALGSELATLDEVTRRALEAAAVAGDPFLLEIAAVAAALPETAMADALDDLQHRDLVRPTDTPRRFRFRHPLVRRAVYGSTPAGWRLGAHERCAQALADRGVPVAGRAHHVIHAARVGDRAAVGLLRDAGEAVVGRAPGEAARWFSAALGLLPTPATADALGLWTALAAAQGAAGRFADAHTALLRAIDLVPRGADATRVQLVAECAGIEQTLGHHDDAHRRLIVALDALPAVDGAEAVALMGAIAQDRLYRTEYAAAREWSQRAHAAGGPPLPMAESAAGLALGAAFSGATTEAATACSEAATLADGMSDEEIAGSADPMIARLAGAEVLVDRHVDAARHAERALAAARALGSRHHLPVLFWTGIVRTALGRLAAAAALLDEAVEAARSSGNPAVLGWMLLARSTTATSAGETDVALATAQESVALLRGATRTLPAAWAAYTVAAALAATDPAAADRTLVSSCGPDLDALPHPFRPGAFALLARCRLALDRPADTAVAAARRCAEESGLTSARAVADAAEAALALHRADPRRAAELAVAAADAAGHVGAAVEAAAARELAGRALAEAGATDDAIAQLRRAAGEFDQCGAPRRAAAVGRRLRALGDRGRQRSRPGTGTAGLDSLTGRELQVARLIVDRRTNAEIGAELFLSGKTVETHVHNVLRKLDVASRVEVARAVERYDRGRPLP